MIPYLIGGWVLLIAIVFAVGAVRSRLETRRLHAALDAARSAIRPATFDTRELTELPAPVQRYFRAVLTPGQPLIAGSDLQHAGSFNMSESAQQWRPFTSNQRVITRRPGFDWHARIRVLPVLSVRVHDAYVAGEGILHASLLGLVSLANLRGSTELAEGELMRFLAEAPWYPTALLPSQGVQWRAVDDRSADATLTDGVLVVTLRFGFDGDGLITSVHADARGRMVRDTVIPTPWEGRWSGYEERDGMCLPTEGEVAWLLPGGRHPYWRGRVTQLSHGFVR